MGRVLEFLPDVGIRESADYVLTIEQSAKDLSFIARQRIEGFCGPLWSDLFACGDAVQSRIRRDDFALANQGWQIETFQSILIGVFLGYIVGWDFPRSHFALVSVQRIFHAAYHLSLVRLPFLYKFFDTLRTHILSPR